MHAPRQCGIKIFGAAIASLFVGLAVIGGFKNYSPVPFWDMWDDYLGFFFQIHRGNWAAWWALHGEHRIVLSRILFWINLALLGGHNWFLIFINYLLVALSVTLFWLILKEQAKDTGRSNETIFLSAFLCAWLFSWIQKENLTWGFQSQFFLAQLLPLAAFYCLHKASVEQKIDAIKERRWFVTACALGVASLGTMANGVLALPLMVVLSIALQFHWRRSAMIALLAVIGNILYFHGYPPHTSDESLRQLLFNHPLGLAEYVLSYLGGPFYYFFGATPNSVYFARLMGLIFIASSCYFLWKSRKLKKSSTSLNLALLIFLLYIEGTALGTAVGRLKLGVQFALSSRYMTPPLLGWVAILALLSPHILKAKSRLKSWCIYSLFGLLLILMLSQQITALESHKEELFERRVAALALEMRIPDHTQIEHIYPSAKTAMLLSEFAVKKNLSIFKEKSIRDGNQLIGKPKNMLPSIICKGSLDKIRKIAHSDSYVQIRGWIYNTKQNRAPDTIYIRSADGVIVGYALVGQPRPDVASNISKGAAYSGFAGYLLTDQVNRYVNIIDSKSQCTFSVHVPYAPIAHQ